MGHITERLVLDWRKKAETVAAARGLVQDVLDELPAVYDRVTWRRKSDAVFDHIFASFYDDGRSVYDSPKPSGAGVATTVAPPRTWQSSAGAIDIDEVTQAVLDRIKSDAKFAEQVAEQLRGKKAFFAVPTDDLIRGDETHEVEFKSTARWNLRDGGKDKRMEDAVVKTVAGFLNTEGGTLLIGVSDAGEPVGLGYDTPLVKPQSADGFVNWLTTHLTSALTHAAVTRTRARIDQVGNLQICRVDVAESSVPVYARMSTKGDNVFWVRMNNSTRALPEIEIESR